MDRASEAGAGTGPRVATELAGTIAGLESGVDWAAVERMADEIANSRKVLVHGSGRSGAVALGIAQRFGHIGLDPAVVGESGNSRFTDRDSLLLVSGSGTTRTGVTLAEMAREAAPGGRIMLLTAAGESPLSRLADSIVRVPARSKAREVEGYAPFTAQFDVAALVVGEAIAKLIMERREMTDQDIEEHRPNVE